MTSPAPKPLRRAVFCDFDGTITTEETFAGMLKLFAPERSAQIMPEIYALRITLRQGVRQMLASIPSTQYPEILAYCRDKEISPGLVELLDFLDARDVPFIVVSGGLRGMVETVLGSLVPRVEAIYAADVDTSGEYLQVFSEFEKDSELVAKVEVIKQYNPLETVAIGDSVTDLNMALHAQIVFAREHLAQYLEPRQKPYIPWQNFFDVRHTLAELWDS
ncbi:MAG TPA: HAD-IB family phosphatase [Oscillatoriaceae cyanobacterium M33_DOE_052]|uniref:2-hydroxy-3-keto-5-methylthiopentenyl-1-phosphate phosphatase n=1 Tax=Planktothricoides sp. SpSt-374 TaxID=2282167 RepID=A0A7C3ZUU9_9CYAN|nr:HAD-IB family phosphatase [Oscillatoriaceae cyanobacterium M33_DOE_052]